MNFNFCPKCGVKDGVKQLDATNHECRECGWHFWNNAKAAVTLLFIQDSQLLFSVHNDKNDPNFGTFDFPGGFVDYGESAQQAAVREAKEELTVDINESDLKLVAAYRNNYASNNIPGITTVDIVFVVMKWSGEFKACSDIPSLGWKPFSSVNEPGFRQKYYSGLYELLTERLAK